jgi:hypothetical protein
VSIIGFLRHIQLIFSLTYKDVESRKMFRGRQQYFSDKLACWHPLWRCVNARFYWMREFTKRLIRSVIVAKKACRWLSFWAADRVLRWGNVFHSSFWAFLL